MEANIELKMCTCVCARACVCVLGVQAVHRLHGNVGGVAVATDVLTA